MLARATHGIAQGVLNAEASSVYQSATSVLGTSTAHVHATVTTISNVPIVEVTSVGGSAITLGTLIPVHGSSHLSQPVATTTFAGHTFVIPSSISHSSSHSQGVGNNGHSVSSSSFHSSSTASSTSVRSTSTSSAYHTSNGAMGMHAFDASKPMLVGAITLLTSLLGGVFVVL
ncbi:hypothetical protein C8Q72DRAFT_843430 [Fomitopsis betulina]|nr:hypothetical protein C8Q72DRAFT_843430 [Fomitopsis betulina]